MTANSIANSFNIACIRLFSECERCAMSHGASQAIQDEIYTNRRRFNSIVGSTPQLPIEESYTYILDISDNIVDGREKFEEYLATFDPRNIDERAGEYNMLDEALTSVRKILSECPIETRERIYELLLEIISCAAKWAQL